MSEQCSCEKLGVLKSEEDRCAACPKRGVEQPVHLVTYASQPDLQIECDKSWTTPAWKQHSKEYKSVHPAGVYETDDGRLYTFDENQATCSACLKSVKEKHE